MFLSRVIRLLVYFSVFTFLDVIDVMTVYRFLLKVHKALPGSRFNSLVLNRYDGNNDYVSWHSDDEVLYGPTPEIASVTFGCEREFLLKKNPVKCLQV